MLCAKNERRCGLIDKEIDDQLTLTEARELDLLQRQFHSHLRAVAPLPLEDARRLQEELSALLATFGICRGDRDACNHHCAKRDRKHDAAAQENQVRKPAAVALLPMKLIV